MTQSTRIISLTTTLVLLAVTAAVLWYFVYIHPPQHLSQLMLRELHDGTVSTDELRKTAHAVLRVDPTSHDALLTLADHGDESSIPLLIESMHHIEKPGPTGGSIVCTSSHCRQALRRTTGQDFAYNNHAWQTWWDSIDQENFVMPPAQD